jgi:hypothetical protein
MKLLLLAVSISIPFQLSVFGQVLRIPVTPNQSYKVIVSGKIDVNTDPTGEDPLPGVVVYATDNREDGSSYFEKVLYGTPSYDNTPDTVSFQNVGDFLYLFAVVDDTASFGTAGYNGAYQVSVNGVSYQLTKKNVVCLNPISSLATPVSAIDSRDRICTEFLLNQNYPNPFNPTTTIRYALAQRSHVTLSVYNTLGQQVSTLVNETQDSGSHDVRFDGSGLASGVYFYRLQAGNFVQTKKLLLLR